MNKEVRVRSSDWLILLDVFQLERFSAQQCPEYNWDRNGGRISLTLFPDYTQDVTVS